MFDSHRPSDIDKLYNKNNTDLQKSVAHKKTEIGQIVPDIFFLIPSIVPQLWKGGARLHDALHATGPDLLCNTNNAKTEPNKIKECIVLY